MQGLARMPRYKKTLFDWEIGILIWLYAYDLGPHGCVYFLKYCELWINQMENIMMRSWPHDFLGGEA